MRLLDQPDGGDFVHRVLDGVIRPESLRAAGRQLELLSRAMPESSPWHQRVLVPLAGGLALITPWPIIPGVRRLFRRASTPLLGTFPAVPPRSHIRHSARHDEKLLATLLLPTASGRYAAERAAERYAALLSRVDEVAVPVQQVADSLTPWDYLRTVERAATQMLPLAADAHRHSVVFVVDVTDLRFAELSVDVGIHLLGMPPLAELSIAITIPAHSPHANQLVDRVRDAARAKRERGGADTRIRIDLRAPATQTAVGLSEWPNAEQRGASHALRVLRSVLTPAPGVSYSIASESVYELAYAAVLAEQAQQDEQIDFSVVLEPDADMAIPQPTDHFSVTRRAAVLEARDFAAVTDLIQMRLLASPTVAPGVRTDDGAPFFSHLSESSSPDGPAVTVSGVAAANRARMAALQERGRTSTLGISEAAAARCVTAEQTERRFAAAARAKVALAARPVASVRDDLTEIAEVWNIYRGRLCEVLINECDQPLAVADSQVTEAVAAARWYAEHSDWAAEVDGAHGDAARTVVIAPPAPFTLGWVAAHVCAALSVGSPALILIDSSVPGARTVAVLSEALIEAGLSPGAVQLVVVDSATSAHRILSHPSAERIIAPATPEWIDTSRLWKPTRRFVLREELPACVVVTETADHTRAVRAIAADAPHSATPITVITVMSEAAAARFTRTLSDAVDSLAAADGVDAPQPDYLEAHDFMAAVGLVDEAAPLSAAVLHTQDPDELQMWAARVGAAQLGANSRIISDASAARYCSTEVLQQLQEWTPRHAEPQPIVTVQGVGVEVTALIEAARSVLSFEQFDRVRLGALDDERVWNLWEARPRTIRQRPTPLVVRAAESADVGELIRVLVAAARAGARPQISTAHPLPKSLLGLLENGFRWPSVVCESDDEWEARIPPEEIPRLRFIGDDESCAGTLAATHCADVWGTRPSASGVLELAAVTREQRLTPGTDGGVQPHSGALATDS